MATGKTREIKIDGCTGFDRKPSEIDPAEPEETPHKTSKAHGWLEGYTKLKALADGTVKEYPIVLGERDKTDADHYFWSYRYEEKTENNGWKKRSISIPRKRISGILVAIANGKPVTEIIETLRNKS